MYVYRSLKVSLNEVMLKKAIDKSISHQHPTFNTPMDSGDTHPEIPHVIPSIRHQSSSQWLQLFLFSSHYSKSSHLDWKDYCKGILCTAHIKIAR